MFIVISIFLLGFLVELQGQNLTSDMSFIEKNERVDRMMESKDKPQDNLTSKKTKMFGKKSYIRAGGNTNGTVKKWKREISDFHSKKQEYDRAINQTIDDYYSQRKVAMDKYYARQKEIFEKFKAKNQDDVTGVTTIKTTTINDETQTTKQPIDSSIAPENSVLGYHRVGERTHKENERLLYQHNLGIGLKGKSEIDAAFEVILDKQVSITCVELIPYNKNSTTTMKILKGGVKYHFIKIKLQPEENHGLSYVIKVWGNDK